MLRLRKDVPKVHTRCGSKDFVIARLCCCKRWQRREEAHYRDRASGTILVLVALETYVRVRKGQIVFGRVSILSF